MSGLGFSWIYRLNRDELIRYLEENQLPAAASDTVADMQARIVQFIREVSDVSSGVPTAQPTLEAKAMLMGQWVAGLQEQNKFLANALEELEEEAVMQARMVASLQALVKRLESDVDSLLQLIHRAMYLGCWDTEGLLFCEVSCQDIFNPSLPPGPASWLDGPCKPRKEEVYMRQSKRQLQTALQQELDCTRQQAKEKEQLVQALEQRLLLSEQHCRETEAVLAAEVADKQEQVVQLMEWVRQLQEEYQQADNQLSLQNNIIGTLIYKAEFYKSKE
ncbi:uncharacterized protein LOC134546320 [Bacillus rossius redtenbacheri]|uniref:uncharacterized protein LOC134546320 n=1 Tax=Bacillus rossius redtenbacheri TaxID=93214 RepID=UPI002FDEC542